MSEQPLAERLAVCTWSLQPADPADLIGQMQQLGMDKIQLGLDPLRADAKWADAGAQLAEAGLTIVSGMFGCEGEDYSTLEAIKRTGGIVPDETWETNWANIRATCSFHSSGCCKKPSPSTSNACPSISNVGINQSPFLNRI